MTRTGDTPAPVRPAPPCKSSEDAPTPRSTLRAQRSTSSRWPTDWSLGTPARLLREVVQRTVLFPALGLVASPLRVYGRDHLEGLSGPVIIVANHSSHLDTPLVLRALPGRLRGRLAVAAAEDYFFCRGWRALAVALALNAVPLPRNGRCGPVALARCGRLLQEGRGLLVFPEGTRSVDGRLGPLRTGTARLAAAYGVPVLPVHIDGAARLLPKGACIPRPGRVTVTFGAPLHLPRHLDARVGTTVIEAALRALSLTGAGPDTAAAGVPLPLPVVAAMSRLGDG